LEGDLTSADDPKSLDRLVIKIVADLACPWCYLGVNRLKRALAMRPRLRYRIVWQSFLLNPDTPLGGIPLPLYAAARGSTDASRLLGGVLRAANMDGVPMNFSRIANVPNSVNAHRLIHWAGNVAADRQFDLIGELYRAYFGDGDDIGQSPVLADIASRVGLQQDEATRFLSGDAERELVLADHRNARGLGIKGVPCFIISDKYAISGAQEPEVFLPLLDLGSVKQQVAI